MLRPLHRYHDRWLAFLSVCLSGIRWGGSCGTENLISKPKHHFNPLFLLVNKLFKVGLCFLLLQLQTVVIFWSFLRHKRLIICVAWWRHQMEIFSALLAICAGNSPLTGEFPAQRPMTRSFDVFFHLWLNTWLSKQPRGWWFETPSRSLWRHRNGMIYPVDPHLLPGFIILNKCISYKSQPII